MGGTLIVAEQLCWMPAKWIYDDVLFAIANRLTKGPLQEQLLDGLTEVNGGYLNLQPATATEIRIIKDVLKAYFDEIKATGPSAMHQPEYFDGYIKHMEQLHDMLTTRLNELDQDEEA